MKPKATIHHASGLPPLFKSATPEQLLLGGTLGLVLLTAGVVKVGPSIYRGLRDCAGALRRREDSIRLGPISLTDNSRTMPTQIMGTTGSGKTVCMEHILWGDLRRGMGALIVDPKGERQFYERVRSYCAKIGREADLHLLSATYPNESIIWNPCGLGNVSELQTKFFNSAIYSEPHYAKACEAALLRAFESLTRIHPDGFSVTYLVEELKRIAAESKEKNIEGLFYDLFNLAHGEWREVLGCDDSKSRKPVSILDVVQSGKILFVDLPTEGKLVQSSRIGRLLTQEIILISGLRKRSPELKTKGFYSVFIDEFDAFGTESFISFLNKGRSSGFLVTLAHQTLSDLIKVSPTFEGQVTGNINTQIVFRLNSADDCEKLARSFGTKSVVSSTYQTAGGMATGTASNRVAQEFRVHPDEIKRLKTGQCVFVMKDKGIIRTIRVPKPIALKTNQTKTPLEVQERGLGNVSRSESATFSADLVASAPVETPRNSYLLVESAKEGEV